MPQRLPRFAAYLERAEDERRLAKILLETGEAAPETVVRATLAGDGVRLRGLPVVCVRNGPGGAIAGTDPVRALLAKEAQQRR